MLIVKGVHDDVLGELFSLLWASQVAPPVFVKLGSELGFTDIARSEHLECFSLVDFESEGELARIKYLKDFKQQIILFKLIDQVLLLQRDVLRLLVRAWNDFCRGIEEGKGVQLPHVELLSAFEEV